MRGTRYGVRAAVLRGPQYSLAVVKHRGLLKDNLMYLTIVQPEERDVEPGFLGAQWLGLGLSPGSCSLGISSFWLEFSLFGISVFLLEFLGSVVNCLLYTSPSPRDKRQSRMPSSA